MTNWDKFDEMFDIEELQEGIKEAAENDGMDELPDGVYPVWVEKMELKETKNGDPMLSIWFRIVEDAEQYGNRIIFYNQVLTQGFQFHIANTMLKSLIEDETVKESIKFTGFGAYAKMIESLYDMISTDYEFDIEVKNKYNKKHDRTFPQYKITKIINVNGNNDSIPTGFNPTDEDIPF